MALPARLLLLALPLLLAPLVPTAAAIPPPLSPGGDCDVDPLGGCDDGAACGVVLLGECAEGGACEVVVSARCGSSGACDVLALGDCIGSCGVTVGSCHGGACTVNLVSPLLPDHLFLLLEGSRHGQCQHGAACAVNVGNVCNGARCDADALASAWLGPVRGLPLGVEACAQEAPHVCMQHPLNPRACVGLP